MRKLLEPIATAAVVLAAIAVGGSAVRREFFPSKSTTGFQADNTPDTTSYVEDWQRFRKFGTWYGDSLATTTIVEFVDYECPFCARFHQRMKDASRATGKPFALLMVQYPLSMHRFATPAAIAAECASNAGRFGPMTDALFARQDSFGLRNWASYAADAGVKDTVAFTRCFKAQSIARISRDMAAGKSFEVRGTPTVMINGWRYSKAPSEVALREVLQTPPRRPHEKR